MHDHTRRNLARIEMAETATAVRYARIAVIAYINALHDEGLLSPAKLLIEQPGAERRGEKRFLTLGITKSPYGIKKSMSRHYIELRANGEVIDSSLDQITTLAVVFGYGRLPYRHFYCNISQSLDPRPHRRRSLGINVRPFAGSRYRR